MIRACIETWSDGSLLVSCTGHAGYDEHGRDIVCSAVSALVQTLAFSLDEVTHENVKYSLTGGNASIEASSLSNEGKTLLRSFLVGMKAIESAYPDNLAVDTRLFKWKQKGS